MTARRRLDAELVRRGLARSRDHAAELVTSGHVRVSGRPTVKPATSVELSAAIVVRQEDGAEYVSRGAHKLIGALDAWDVPVEGRRCLDAGASTGGFTEVLLRRGAATVAAVDVGYGQLDWSLRSDPRVLVLERTNVRRLRPADIGGHVHLVVADLSFISLRLVLDALLACTRADGELVLMVKPQFEVGREHVGSGGVVREPTLRAAAVQSVAEAVVARGWGIAGVVASPLPGPSGNVEYFLHVQRDAGPLDPVALAAAVAHGPA